MSLEPKEPDIVAAEHFQTSIDVLFEQLKPLKLIEEKRIKRALSYASFLISREAGIDGNL